MTTFAMPRPSPVVGALLTLSASRPAAVELTATSVVVRLGVTWRCEVPRDSVAAAARVEVRRPSVGAHGGAGRWLVNTAHTGLVRLDIEPEASARCLGVPVRLHELTVSLADPDAFLQELGDSTSV